MQTPEVMELSKKIKEKLHECDVHGKVSSLSLSLVIVLLIVHDKCT